MKEGLRFAYFVLRNEQGRKSVEMHFGHTDAEGLPCSSYLDGELKDLSGRWSGYDARSFCGTKYREVHEVTLRDAERMVKVYRKMERAVEKYSTEYCYPDGWMQAFLHLKALGVLNIGLWDSQGSRRSDWRDGTFRMMGASAHSIERIVTEALAEEATL